MKFCMLIHVVTCQQFRTTRMHNNIFDGRSFAENQLLRTTCIRQGFWPPLKPKIESYFTTFSLDYFVRRMTKVFIFYNDLTSYVAMVTENGRQYRLKLKKCHFGPQFGGFTDSVFKN